MVSKEESIGDHSWKLNLPQLLGALKLCVLGTLVVTETDSVIDNGKIVPRRKMVSCVFWCFGSCIQGFTYCKPIIQVDGTWLYQKYIGTLFIATV